MIRSSLTKEHKVLSDEQIQKVIKKQTMIKKAQEAQEEKKSNHF